MEAELDLDNYLQCFTDLDVPADNIDLNDAELEKANILYDGDRPFEPPVLNGYERHVTYGPSYQLPDRYEPESYPMNCDIKPEVETSIKSRRPIKRRTYEDYQYTGHSSDSSENESLGDSYVEPVKKSKRSSLANFKPQTKARKYQTKPADEKAEPTYKLKRARNNDAVRKCRNRAQELKKQKDEEYDQMKARIVELEQLVESERQGRLRSEKLLEELIQNQQKPSMQNVKQEPINRFVPGTSSRCSKRH